MNTAISRLDRAGTGSDEQTFIGPYPLLRRLAAGGMAELFLAWQGPRGPRKRLVVVKRILPRFSKNEQFLRMFADEANIAALLQHPNLVQLVDWGNDENGPYYAMEYVRGVDLRKLLNQCYRDRTVIPLGVALRIIVDAAAGLHAAHETRSLEGAPLDLVHRDVSLSNVLVSYDGAVKVLDFGIAKASERRAETEGGLRKGKVSYMSPEQVRNEELDRRSDVFSLGVLLFELTCGRRLHTEDKLIQVARNLAVGRIAKPSQVHDNYPEALERIVNKALHPIREQRYQSAKELQLALEEYAAAEGLILSSAGLASFVSESFRDERTLRQLLDNKSVVDERRLGSGLAELPTLVRPPANDELGDDDALELCERAPQQARQQAPRQELGGDELPLESPPAPASFARPLLTGAIAITGLTLAFALGLLVG